MPNDNAGAPGAAATQPPAGAPGTTRSFMTTATGEQVEIPPEVVQALRTSSGAGTVDIAQADGTRLTLQVPTRSRRLPPGADLGGLRPGLNLNRPGAEPEGADGPVMFRRTSAEQYAVNKAALPEGEGLAGQDEMDDAIAAAALEAIAPEALRAGKTRAQVAPVGARPTDIVLAPEAESTDVTNAADDASDEPQAAATVEPEASASASVEGATVVDPSPAAEASTPLASALQQPESVAALDPGSPVALTTPDAAPEPAAPPEPPAAITPRQPDASTAVGASPETAQQSPVVPEVASPTVEAADRPTPLAGAPIEAPAVQPPAALTRDDVAEPAGSADAPEVADDTSAPPSDAAGAGGGIGTDDPAAQASMERAEAANTELRSEEIDEILTTMPGGLLRWGASAVFVTLAVLLGIGWYIRYPDLVQGGVSLTTTTPPVRVVSHAAGEVERVFVADRAPVHAGDPLLLLKSPARYEDVREVSAALDRMEPGLQRSGDLPALAFDRPLALGELQAQFSTLQQAYSDYRTLLADPFYGQKVAATQAQVANLEQLRDRLKAQQDLLDDQLALADRNRARSRQLGTQNLSSSAEVEQSEQQYLQQRYATENGRTAITNNEIQLSGQRSALLDLQQRRADDEQRLLVELRNAHHTLRATITAWEQSYLLRSPVSGTVSLFRDLHENQFVGAQDPLIAVLPARGAIVGRVSLSGVGAGKVRVGQRVIVQLDNYPYREYGTVEGRVTRISQLGFEQTSQGQSPGLVYQAEVSLPHGMVTSYGRRLEFTQEMRGTVQVVTEDVRLLQRVFNQIRSLREMH